jgi:predicted RNase H-like HicB family nuclease
VYLRVPMLPRRTTRAVPRIKGAMRPRWRGRETTTRTKRKREPLDSLGINGIRWRSMTIELEEESDGRWIAEVMELSGAMVYGQTRDEAVSRAKALALRVMADRLEHGESIPELREVFRVAA